MTIQEFVSFLIEATPEQQTMYHKLTMKLHPDRQGNPELMKQLNAYKDDGNWSAIERMYRTQIGEPPKSRKKAKKKNFDLTGQIIAFENGNLSEDEVIELFQHLVDTGMAWQLQGSYGRMANNLINAGYVHR